MSHLAKVYIFKIGATLLAWCAPLLLLPGWLLTELGFPPQDTYMWVRMLGWAYLALCVGYGIGLKAALRGEYIEGPVYVGIVSNGGGCAFLTWYAVTGAWSEWGAMIQFIGWSSIVATFLITLGLYVFGVRAHGDAREEKT